VLEPTPSGPAAWFAAALGRGRHPASVFSAAILGGLVALTACSVGAGYLLISLLGHTPDLASANRHFDSWLAGHRTPGRTEASLIGSVVAGGVVLPIVSGLAAVAFALRRKWRIAAYAVLSLVVESAAYRGTSLLFHEHRPRVHRLEQLPVNASFPSGHTAASIAVYGGLVLLLTSRFRSPIVRAVARPAVVGITVWVALSRMYRGMHYPLDTLGGALLGIGALGMIVFACRAAGAAEVYRRRIR